MTYEPIEGVDYLTDLYQVVEVPRDASTKEIKSALAKRTMQYHPDRLEGVAPEFKTKGERMAALLNRARTILLDADKREEYDTIIDSWEGLISSDGTPAFRIGDAIRHDAAQKSPEELEAAISEQGAMATSLFKHDAAKLKMLTTLYESAEPGDMKEQLRDALDAALLAEDQVLATTQDTRAQLVGIAGNSLITIGENHADSVALAIETARTEQVVEYQRRALGGVGARLALLAGAKEESDDIEATALQFPAEHGLPAYYETQAERLLEVAELRQDVVEKRLELFEPQYPISELQTEAHSRFVVGVAFEKNPQDFTWIGFQFDAAAVSLENIDVEDDVKLKLNNAEYEAIYASGMNIVTMVSKEQIDVKALLDETYNKHLKKYFPGVFEEKEE